MKKVLCLLALTFAVLGKATEKLYFTYGSVQAMGGYPMIGAGVRTQKGIHTFDFSGNICPIRPPVTLNIFHLRSLYLVYPNRTGLYFGGGLGLLNEPETIKISGSFESAIGFQWANRIFLEGSAIVPLKQSPAISPIWPVLTLGFGF
jgi:hypothetical protein